jgi:lipopolysaccharide export system permease protein
VGAWFISFISDFFITAANRKILGEKKTVKIIQRYIAKNVLMSTISVFIVVLALSFIIGLLKELHDIGVGDYGFGHAILYVLLLLPHTLYQFFPLLVLVGGVVGLGILAASHELTVMRTAGVSVRQVVWAVMSAALILIFSMTLLGECLAPAAYYWGEKRKSIAISSGQAVATLAGVWIHEGSNFLHIDRVIGHHHLEGITRYEFDHAHGLLAAYFAKTMDFQGGRWLLHDLVKTTLQKDRAHSTHFLLAAWNFNLTPSLLNVGMIEPEAMSLQKLTEYSHYLEKNHLQASSFELEFWQRVFQPLAILVMMLLAIPFVLVVPRSMSVGRQILLAIITGFVFYILAALLGQFSIVFQFPPLVAALFPILLFASIGYFFMARIKN